MDEIGYKIDPAILHENVKVSDLINYEGPVLSHFTNSSDEHYLYYWVDQSKVATRWLIVKVGFWDIKSYLQNELHH